MKYTLTALTAIVIYAMVIVCGRPGKAVVATGPGKVRVVSEADCSFHTGITIIAELEVGDTVITLNYDYPKDCMVYEVELKDGRKGWVTVGDNCEVVDMH